MVIPSIHLVLLAILLFKWTERVDAHAVQIYPSGPCGWPSKARPCGCNGVNLVKPGAVWKANSTQWVTWYAINNDGLGYLKINIAAAGNYTNLYNLTSITVNNPPGNPPFQVDSYTFVSVVVPENITCHLPGNVCILQMWTDSGGGWYGCSAVQILPATAVIEPNVNVNCGTYPGGVCSAQRYNKYIAFPFCHIPSNQAWWETQASNLYHQVSNTKYFTNFSSPACQAVFMNYFCDLIYPFCNGTGVNQVPTFTPGIQQECATMMTACGGTALATATFPCSLTYAQAIYPKDLLPVVVPTVAPPPSSSSGRNSSNKLGVGLLSTIVLALILM